MPSNLRVETDSLGKVEVPADKYWGAQTQRSLQHFSIGNDLIPIETVHAMGLIKKAAALSNKALGALSSDKADLIIQAAEELIAGKLNDQFPLHVWMTGSGTQSNMNVNEVVSNRAIEIAGGVLGSKTPIHPNDHVNMSQSSNDVFPTAMCITTALLFNNTLLPALDKIHQSLFKKVDAWKDIVKIGRTHMQDAVPLTLGQEFSGYATMIEDNINRIKWAVQDVYKLTLGGTAVGTGLNTLDGFAEKAADNIAKLTGLPFITAPNKFATQGAHDALIMASCTLKTLACSLFKIANDIRILSCGPRAGFNELMIPSNEPGSSIMPGKVNPTQCEAMTMAAAQVMGYDVAVGIGGASGYLEMNVYKPMMIFNIVQSVKILSDCCHNFTDFLLEGVQPNLKKINQYVNESLMLVTALSPTIGYDKASQMSHYAFDHDLSLSEANKALKIMPEDAFNAVMAPDKIKLMCHIQK
jgi:fumarate hydratase class II